MIHRSRTTAAALAVLAAMAAAGCDDDDNGTAPLVEEVVLAFTGLEPLAGGFHYEGWAIVDGAPVSTGKFDVAAGGGLVDLSGQPVAGGVFTTGVDLSGASAIVITIEPAGDTDAVPAETKILAGTLTSGGATLSVGAQPALGSGFAEVSGGYILATPTDGPDSNERSGIWFLDPAAGPGASLVLPTLPPGWRYEGWVVIDGTPVTTGTFTSVSGADGAAPFSGDMAGPPFPGEDFLQGAPEGLTFPTDLAGGTAVISVEPFPDDAAAPFTLKPLVGSIPADADDHVLYAMDANPGSLPGGSATVR